MTAVVDPCIKSNSVSFMADLNIISDSPVIHNYLDNLIDVLLHSGNRLLLFRLFSQKNYNSLETPQREEGQITEQKNKKDNTLALANFESA